MDATSERRIVLLGKSGSGKSSLGNTLLGDSLLKTKTSPISETSECQAESKFINGRNITVVDTPGFFDTYRSEEEMKPAIMRCMVECAPGPHAFLIVLKVDRFTEQEQAVITKIREYFSEEALKYAVIVFTHGDQLSEGMRIDEFVIQNKDLSDLVKKCGGRCHVVDNKYWKNKPQDEYRSNKFQVAELLNTIDKMVVENKGGWYTKKREPKKEGNKTSVRNVPQGDASSETNSVWISLTGPAAESFVKAVFGPPAVVMQETGAAASGAEKETEEKASTEKDKNAAKETEGGGFGGFLSCLAIVAAGLAAAAGGVGSILAAGLSAAASAGGVGSTAAAAGLAAAAAAGGVGSTAAAALDSVLRVAAGLLRANVVGRVTWVLAKIAQYILWAWQIFQQLKELFKEAQRHSRIIVLVIAFYSLLLLSFCVRLPIAGTLVQFLGILLMLLLSVVLLLLLWM